MSKRLRWTAGAIGLAALVWASTALAAPAPQEGEPTPTPAGAEGAVSGEVEARVLVVRAGAATNWAAVGGLPAGTTISVIGRSPDGRWLLVEWEGGQGWVSAEYVGLGEGVEAGQLPTSLPPTSPPVPTSTLTPTPSASATPAPSATASPSPTSAPTETASPTSSPTPTETHIAPTATATEARTPTPVSGAGAAATTAPSAPAISLPRIRPPSRGALIGIGGGAAALVLGVILYGWRWRRGRRELARYADGFVLETCPVCQRGALTLEEGVTRSLGVPGVRRTVRCDTCRSVLRQVRPGQWRLTIDPRVNPALAEGQRGQTLADAELPVFAEKARTYEPRDPLAGAFDDSEEFHRAVERLESLEASVLAEGQDQNAPAADPATGAGDASDGAPDEAKEEDAPDEA